MNLNYVSGLKLPIKKHVEEAYNFTPYDTEPDYKIRTQKAKEFASQELYGTLPLRGETIMFISKYVKYINDIKRWFVFEPSKGIWHTSEDDNEVRNIVGDIMNMIIEQAYAYSDDGLMLYAQTIIDKKLNGVASSLKGSIYLRVPTYKDIHNYNYRLFKTTNGALALMDLDQDDFNIKKVKPEDIRDLYLEHSAPFPINADNYNEPTEWLSMIRDVMTKDTDMAPEIDEKVDYFKKVLAYMMSPRNYAQAFVWFIGNKGGNGKSTVFHVMQDILGKQYAIEIDSQFLVQHNYGFKMDDAKGVMDGHSLYFFNEFNKTEELSTKVIKQLTDAKGVAMIRPAYSKEHEVELIGIPVGVCNELPYLCKEDSYEAVSRRLVVVRFDHVFTNPDLGIEQRLTDAYADIQVWLYMNYFEHKGINICPPPFGSTPAPLAFVETKKSYFDSMETVKSFFDECICKAPGATLKRSNVYKAYAEYAEYKGLKPVSRFSEKWTDALTKAMGGTVKRDGYDTYIGVEFTDFYNHEVVESISR